MPSDHFFRVSNHHAASCGTPPACDDLTAPEITYRSYFENEHGDQWVLLYDNDQDIVFLYGGDCGWETPLKVYTLQQIAEGMAKAYQQPSLLEHSCLADQPGMPVVIGTGDMVNLNEPERLWLTGCLAALNRRRGEYGSTGRGDDEADDLRE